MKLIFFLKHIRRKRGQLQNSNFRDHVFQYSRYFDFPHDIFGSVTSDHALHLTKVFINHEFYA